MIPRFTEVGKERLLIIGVMLLGALIIFLCMILTPPSSGELSSVRVATASLSAAMKSVNNKALSETPAIDDKSNGVADDMIANHGKVDDYEESGGGAAAVVSQDVPFLYELNQDRVARLSPDQQDSILKAHEEFIAFYRSNPAAFQDASLMTQEVGALRERVVNAIGIDGFEELFHE
jgi:hypothetical protein